LSFAAGWVAEIGDGTEAANDALATGLLGEISADGSDAVQHAVAFIEPYGQIRRSRQFRPAGIGINLKRAVPPIPTNSA
jgi:hypothetical protein